jgi:superfamily I DNA/RNA helicase
VVAAVQRLLARGRRRSELAILVRDHADLAEIRRALQLKGLDIARDGEGEGIRLLTFHGAKGLEFPVVLLPFLERGKFPNTRRLGRDRAALRERLEAAREALDRVEARASEQSRSSGKAREGAFGARLKASPQSNDSPRLERVSPSLWTRLRQWWQRFLSPPPRPPSSPPTAPALDVDPDLELAAWFPVLDKAWAGLDQEQQAILHEERRLFYVALTRAREELYLFCSSFAQRSDFLRGVPSGVLEWVEDPLDDLGRSGR